MNNFIQEVNVREVSHKEYRAFTRQSVDKGQLGFPLMVTLLVDDTLIAVKYNFSASVEDELNRIKKMYLNQQDIEVVSIDEFNYEASKSKDKVRINKSYYENKNFIITGVKL